MIWIIMFLSLTIMIPTLNDTEGQSADTLPTCMPFSAIFIWHTGGGDDTSFYQQMRLIIKLILDFPECTEVSLVRVGAKVNTKMRFRKESTNQSWIYQLVQHKPGHSGTHVIPKRKISDAILRNENHKMAEEVFLVVNNNSVIADKQEAAKALRKKNTWIIFSGEPTSKHVWTDLATDIFHFVILEDNTGSINCTAKSILIQTCRDIIPDTDSIMDDRNCHIDVHSTINSIIIVLMIIYYFLHERVKRNLQSLCSTCFRKDNTPVAEHSADGQDQELNDRNENQFTKEQLGLDANASTTVEGEILDMTVAGRQSNLPIPPIARQDFEQEEHPLINQQNGNGEQT
ncbi:uncharacterized protein LOC128557562 isoform X2 [Mercenaria mercenaria]|uniref:uncharacterized protein LOC128557562 isoform X2 n=1 Tax=Mercenaria mercenaria TaxID=6596 RepID=UPI00234F2569|nr:uncharacterized protein LOC128557562 isoform X2 [Mercenaria mercenaria]